MESKLFKLRNEPIYEIGSISRREMIEKKYVTDIIWEEFLDGDSGKLIERLVLRYFISELNYSNVKQAKSKAEAWDFILVNDPAKKIDIRRVSPRNTMNLGHTNGALTKIKWEVKAKKLDDGGYIGVKVLKDRFVLFYVSAKALIALKKEFGNVVHLKKLRECFHADFLLTLIRI